jgi:hypothetical protein
VSGWLVNGMQGVRGSNPLSSTRHNASAGLPLRVVCQQITPCSGDVALSVVRFGGYWIVLGQGWKAQWARVHRRFDDVRAVYSGRPGGTDAAIDIVQSFFESVHHLKDWLGNDPSSGVTKADGDRLINESPVLKLCADLANGSKHLKLSGTRSGISRRRSLETT